jgi:SAM-dependent methyltransferase
VAGASEHWRRVWATKAPQEVSWFEQTPSMSLAMIEGLALPKDAPIIDLGGGASGLAGELVRRGYTDVTVADISAAALATAGRALGAEADRVDWVVADGRSHDFGRRFAVWHDRAMFHFLTERVDRDRYLEVLERSLLPAGHVIIATFGPGGPTMCSGLPVVRYGADDLAALFAPAAKLVSDRHHVHETPSGKEQQFLYAHLEAR